MTTNKQNWERERLQLEKAFKALSISFISAVCNGKVEHADSDADQLLLVVEDLISLAKKKEH